MKVYVAARFSEKDTVLELYKVLQKNGHEITADWTKHTNIKPYDEHKVIAEEYAVEDLQGVLDADVFILLTSESVGSGSSAELGAAIAAKEISGTPKIYVVGEHMGNNVFYYHPAVIRKITIDEILAEIT